MKKKLSRFVRRWWWAFVGVAMGIFVLVWRLMAIRQPSSGQLPAQLPTIADRARQEVERVRLEGEVEKARVVASADAQRVELDQIEEVAKENPREARRQLSTWLSRNL